MVGSGNLEVLSSRRELGGACAIEIKTAAAASARSGRRCWTTSTRAIRWPDVRISINDMGATPAVVSLRLDQAVEELRGKSAMNHSYFETSARERLAGLLDAGSFHELLPPSERVRQPASARSSTCRPPSTTAWRSGRGLLDGRPVLAAAQEGGFMGGAVGEVHGAKLVGLLRRALRERPAAVLLLLESGGVRLHEANAGLIAVSEVMRAVLDARAGRHSRSSR